MELLEKEEQYIGYVLRRIGDCLIVAFFLYTYPGLLLVRKIFESDLVLRPVNVIMCVLYLAVSVAIICRIIIVLTGRYLSVPVLHKYLSRSEVRQLFENEHFEQPAELKGTLLEGDVFVSEHWLCLYHHFIRRDKAAYIWKSFRGTYSSHKPFVLHVLYGSGDVFHFDGEDWRHFEKRWEEFDLFWHYLACNIAGGTDRSLGYYFLRDALKETCRRNFPSKEEKRNYFMRKEGMEKDTEQMAKLYGEIDVKNFAFIKFIDQAVFILLKRERDDACKLFHDRYKEMRTNLEGVRSDFVKKALHNKRADLKVRWMVKYGDDEELKDAISAVNRYYQDHIYSEK